MTLYQICTQNRIWGILGSLTLSVIFGSVRVEAGSDQALRDSGRPAAQSMVATQPTDVTKLEEAIAVANADELPRLEVKIARLLQERPTDIHANYLMSTLLLRMFTVEPGSFSLIKQSTELAAQTYDLDRSSDLGIAALANILEVSGETERGLAMLNEVTRRGSKLGWRSNLAKARLLSNGRNPELVIKQLDQTLLSPGVSHELIAPTLIAALLEKYEGEEEIKELQQWSRRCHATDIQLAIASAYAMNGYNDAAMKIYASIITMNPRNIEALINHGIIALRSQRTEIAIQRFKDAIKYATYAGDLTAAKTHLALALILEKKDSQAAREASYAAIKSASDSEGVLVGILAAYRRHGDVKTTLSFLEGLEYSVPGLHLGHALKAELLSEKLGRYYDAMISFTNAIALEPGRSEYYNGRGLTWMGIGRIETALSDFESATFANPDDASARYNVACALARLGRKEDALASLGKAFELDERLLAHAQSDQDLASLRSEPLFKALLNPEARQVSVAH